MNLNESYIYRKEVDWSLLHEGLTIPVRLQVAFRNLLNGYELGVGRRVTLLCEGQPFDSVLINQNEADTVLAGITEEEFDRVAWYLATIVL